MGTWSVYSGWKCLSTNDICGQGQGHFFTKQLTYSRFGWGSTPQDPLVSCTHYQISCVPDQIIAYHPKSGATHHFTGSSEVATVVNLDRPASTHLVPELLCDMPLIFPWHTSSFNVSHLEFKDWELDGFDLLGGWAGMKNHLVQGRNWLWSSSQLFYEATHRSTKHPQLPEKYTYLWSNSVVDHLVSFMCSLSPA